MDLVQGLLVSSVEEFLRQHDFMSPVKHVEPEDEETRINEEELESASYIKPTPRLFPELRTLEPHANPGVDQPAVFASLQDEVST